jgi:hypothetical protein
MPMVTCGNETHAFGGDMHTSNRSGSSENFETKRELLRHMRN